MKLWASRNEWHGIDGIESVNVYAFSQESVDTLLDSPQPASTYSPSAFLCSATSAGRQSSLQPFPLRHPSHLPTRNPNHNHNHTYISRITNFLRTTNQFTSRTFSASFLNTHTCFSHKRRYGWTGQVHTFSLLTLGGRETKKEAYTGWLNVWVFHTNLTKVIN